VNGWIIKMENKDIKQYIRDVIADSDSGLSQLQEKELGDLIIWAYDKGWQEGIEDYREEQDPTEHQEWRNSR